MNPATEPSALVRQRLLPVIAIAIAIASLSTAAGAEWVRVASSPDVQVFVDPGSLTKDSDGLISVWARTLYVTPQSAAGMQYSAGMTFFVLDCVSAHYGLAGGKFFDAQGKMLLEFHGPAGDLQPIPMATKVDAVRKAVCIKGGDARRPK